MAAAGLQTHIWNNNLRSILLLAAYPFILGAIVWACASIFAMSQSVNGTFERAGAMGWNLVLEFWPIIFSVAAIWFMISYFFHGSMIRRMAHSHPVTREEEPELYNLFENLCISQGMVMPQLEIIETHARNAFASGIDKKSFRVTVTRGLLQSLSRDEVEGVLAHELTHIINRDVRLLMVCIVFTGMIGVAAQIVWSSVRYSLWVPRRSSGKGGGNGMILLLAILLILWAGYFATLFTRFALSRRREYMADAGAVQVTKNPEGMMRALMRIAGTDRIPEATDDIAMMCIENSHPFMGLFTTHPPIQKRIEALSALTGTPVPDMPLKQRASGADRFMAPQEGRENWLTRQRFKERRKNPWV